MSALPLVRPTSFEDDLAAHRALFDQLQDLQPAIQRAATVMADTLRANRKLMLMGNGGSAADCQHIAAQLTGHFRHHERRPLAALALTADSSTLTGISSADGFEQVFARQLAGLAQPGDCAVGISATGRAPNVLRALERARILGLTTIGLTGHDGGLMRDLCDVCIVVPHTDTARIQEAHLFIGHSWCSQIEQQLLM